MDQSGLSIGAFTEYVLTRPDVRKVRKWLSGTRPVDDPEVLDWLERVESVHGEPLAGGRFRVVIEYRAGTVLPPDPAATP